MSQDYRNTYNTQALHSESSIPPVERSTFEVGSKISNKYTLVELLGDGGMGKVYKAKFTIEGRYHKIDKYYAVKLLDIKGRDIQEQDLIRFERECKLLASLEHENIVKLHEYNPIEQYLIMEYLEGETLDKIISRNGFIDLETFKIIASQICKGLDYVHSKGIIHRDLKPSNIFICEKEGHIAVKIIDFGVARQATDMSATVVGSLVGTRPYASPEQKRGIDIQKTSDIYTLGIIFYEMLTGKRLNAEMQELPLLQRDRPEYQNKAIPRHLCLIIKKMLSINPEDRPASTMEVLEHIENVYRTNSVILSSLIENKSIKLYDIRTIIRLISDKFIEIKRNEILHKKITTNDIFLYTSNGNITIEIEPIIESKLGLRRVSEDFIEGELSELIDIHCLGKIIYEIVTTDKLKTGEEVLAKNIDSEKHYRQLFSLSERILSKNSYTTLEEIHTEIIHICNDQPQNTNINVEKLQDKASIKNSSIDTRIILYGSAFTVFTLTIAILVTYYAYTILKSSDKNILIQPPSSQPSEQQSPYPTNFVVIKKGEYIVRFDDQGKFYKDTIDEFAISKYEVRNSEYIEFISNDENKKKVFFQRIRRIYNLEKSLNPEKILALYGDYPVVGITEEEAKEYCEWMNNTKSDKNIQYCLPSYNEWNAVAYGNSTIQPTFKEVKQLKKVDDEENDKTQDKIVAMLSNAYEIVAWSDKKTKEEVETKYGLCLVIRGVPDVELIPLNRYNERNPKYLKTGFRLAAKRRN